MGEGAPITGHLRTPFYVYFFNSEKTLILLDFLYFNFSL